MSYKVDLHTHSDGSPDGGLSAEDYRKMLQSGGLDYCAITDHDSIEAALAIKNIIGEHIIVGEEITTADGEMIGLFLQQVIQAGLSAADTAAAIHEQGGLVYVPHPFETVRRGMKLVTLETLTSQLDIIEGYNGRAVFQNRGEQARAFATKHQLPGAASSDAHGRVGWGKTYSVITDVPTAANLAGLLRKASYSQRTVGAGILYPKLNRLRKRYA